MNNRRQESLVALTEESLDTVSIENCEKRMKPAKAKGIEETVKNQKRGVDDTKEGK